MGRFRGCVRPLAVWVLGAVLPVVAVGAAEEKAPTISDLRKAAIACDVPSLRAAAAGLLAAETPAGVQAVIQCGFVCDNWDLEREIGGLLAGLSTPEARAVVCQQARAARDWRARVVLAAVLGQWAGESGGDEAFEALVGMLRDPVNSVVVAVIPQLQRLEDARCIGPLIALAAQRESRGRDAVWGQVEKLLEALTGERFDEAADWKNWWEPRKRTFDIKRDRPKEGTLKPPTGRTIVKRPDFFGHEVNSKQPLFILDVSGSMLKRDPLPEEGEAGGEPPPSRERLRRVQAELIRVIQGLDESTMFNIITFCHKIIPFNDQPVAATRTNKLRAIQFVEGFRAEGQTYTDTVLERAFAMKDRVDTIFLLSDGAPRRDDKLLDTGPILEMVRRENRFKKIIINTVGFEQAGTKLRRFMAELARQNNGEYKELR
ncbi:MAG: VWA domain-containing protein [Planctomycetes bacterium]|nr:VWA domain-containing protein [Planctomycetota bacterium]